MRSRLVALAVGAVGAVACGSAAPPTAAPSRPAAPTQSVASPSGGISREEAERHDVLHAGYAVGVTGPLRAETEPGEPARIVFTVTNLGDRHDTYTVAATSGRDTLVVRPARLAVRAGEQAVVEVLGPTGNGRADVRVVVRSTSDRGVSDEATTTVVVR